MPTPNGKPTPNEIWGQCTTYTQFVHLMIKHGWIDPQNGPVPTTQLLGMQRLDASGTVDEQ